MQSLNKYVVLGLLSLSSVQTLRAQDDLLDFLESKEEPRVEYAFATFKNTRLISGHSIETNAEGVLQFIISHRFGRVNSGWRDLYGLDNSTIRLGFEYGLTDRLNIGIGRSSYLKTYDGTFKMKILRQKSGAEKFPLTATWISSMYLSATEWSNPERVNYLTSKLTFHHALLFARKFNSNLSLQLMPTMVHRNLVPLEVDHNSMFSIGAGGSVRLNGSLRLNAEYYYILPNQYISLVGGEKITNSLSIGIDLETGGHVFQLHFTNSRGMTEKYLIGETTGSWIDGDIHFGFNVSRVFTIKKPKEFKNEE